MKKPVIAIFIIVIMIFIFLFFNSYNLFLGEGESMNPTFNNCVLLVVEPKIDISLIQKGEIILINISGIKTKLNLTKIAHRVVENDVVDRKISTRGDNPSIYDSPTQIDGEFDYERILGKVKYYFNIPNYFCNKE